MVSVGSRASSLARSDDDDLPLVDLIALSRATSTDLPPRKRPHSPAGRSGSESCSGEEAPAPVPKMGTARRGRGRPSTPGQYVGLYKARKEAEEALKAAEREEQAARESAEERRASLRNPRDPPVRERDPEMCTAQELQTRLQDALEDIKSVSRVSKGLKGTSQKSLKVAVGRIAEVAEVLFDRTTTEEVRRLRAENARLAAQVQEMVAAQEAMRADLAGLRKSHAVPTQDAPQDPQMAQVLKELSNLSSRFSFLEARVLRPPLGARQTAPASQAAPSYAAKAATPRAAPTAAPTSPSAPMEQRKAKKRSKKAAAPEASASAAPTSVAKTSSSSQQAAGSWETVGAKRKAAKAKRKAAKKEAKARRRLRAPRSTAVVITLQPAAKERGVDYGTVMKQAREKIDLQALEIEGGLRMKSTRTGARLLEIPGATSGPKADALANQLRASFPPEDITVSRPTKRADVRISGLDDSVSSEEVVAAVAKAAGCPGADIRCGVVRAGVRGLGAVVVSCPVAAAQKLADGRRILVGWVSAQAKLLQPRPDRCYRCFAVGHVGVACSAKVDCGDKCFRCSRPGHKAGSCEATPHCFICAAAGRAAEHRIGSKACAGGVTRAKTVEGATASRQPAPKKGGGTQKGPAPIVVGEAEMDTQ